MMQSNKKRDKDPIPAANHVLQSPRAEESNRHKAVHDSDESSNRDLEEEMMILDNYFT